jgi:hypothetical protein
MGSFGSICFWFHPHFLPITPTPFMKYLFRIYGCTKLTLSVPGGAILAPPWFVASALLRAIVYMFVLSRTYPADTLLSERFAKALRMSHKLSTLSRLGRLGS